jgi:NAD(P)H-hydrate repair Nnr-like enzyme with NAD(P)H-hydrate dehydratase domain
VEVANMIAARFNAFVALKGVGTVCAMPNGTYFINSSGNPGLASAGTGDVLSGFIGALMAQGLHPRDALLLGVHLHGAAADRLVEQGVGPIGMTASEVIDAGRALLNAWTY